MERNFTNRIPLVPLAILGKNKNTRNSLRGSLLRSVAFLFFMLFLSLSIFTGNSAYASNLTGPGVKSLSSQKELRAVWFSYLDWINMPKEEQAFRAEAAKVMDNLQKNGFQTIFLHVHSHSDSYGKKMTVFPYSKFMPGNGSFDPLEIMISEAKKKGISVHAWFNPYRVSSSMSKWENIPEDSLVKKWSRTSGEERNVLLHEGQYYINPSRAAGREALLASIKELLDNYAVDGIHFDDYFYPRVSLTEEGKRFDEPEYEEAKRQGETGSLTEYRRNQVSLLLKQVHSLCKERGVVFGVSPVPNLQSLRSSVAYFLDVDKIMASKDYIDYIMPQMYHGFRAKNGKGQEAPHAYMRSLGDWVNLTNSTGNQVELMLGLGLYRAGSTVWDGNPVSEWFTESDILKRQVEEARKTGIVKGYAVFAYQNLLEERAQRELGNLRSVFQN